MSCAEIDFEGMARAMSFDWHGLEPYATITLPDRWPWEKTMTREELIEKMLDSWFDYSGKQDMSSVEGQTSRMAAALDLAVGELLGEPTFDDMFWVIEPDKSCRNLDAATYGKCCQVLASRRSHYLKPKSAEEKLRDEIYTILRKWQTVDDPFNCNEESAEKVTERIVTAVRKVDAK